MKRSSIIFTFLTLFCGCTDEVASLLFKEADQESTSCKTLVTVRDITGLDACSGFVFELEDGTKLRPVITFFCGTPPVPKDVQENPLEGFEFVDGKKVWINYEVLETDFADACMVGQYARITCLTEVQLSSNDTR
jgi:hypothetical protein